MDESLSRRAKAGLHLLVFRPHSSVLVLTLPSSVLIHSLGFGRRDQPELAVENSNQVVKVAGAVP